MLFSPFRQRPKSREPQRKRATLRLAVEQLEDRTVPSTFEVLNLNDSGAGSLRQAILDANGAPGADLINFNVAGTIQLISGALPDLTGKVDIDGRTAPGFAGTPVVEVDYNGFGGLRFNANSGGSSLISLGHVYAAGAGITLNGRDMLVAGNFIGLRLDGVTVAGNGGNGLEINTSSSGNTIGGTSAQDRNVISGNGGNGIALLGSSQNQIVANFIGTDVSGALDLGNRGNGILLTSGATKNTIGGTTPATSAALKPPDGNVISGNDANGVLLTRGANSNTLAGNFIGTDLTGLDDLGNALDGVAIVDGANSNALIGTFIDLPPFVFYNVLSGNDGNGLRIRDSNHTVIQANFFGLGADNNTPVGNTLNGLVVEGSSANTTLGGVIPLGNVVAANGQNGVVVRDTARNFISFNTFGGLAAFSLNPNLGNALDGFLITSTGSNIVLRTNVISSNGDDGIEISGDARGVQVVQNNIGTDTTGSQAMGNVDNGIEVGGNARDIVIGGQQPTFSIIPHNVISGNGGNGVAILGNARDVQVNFSYIGTDSRGEAAIANTGAGVFLGDGTHSTTVGSRNSDFLTVISGNLGDGIVMQGTRDNVVVGSLIGTNPAGSMPIPNGGNGIHIINSFNNVIGGTSQGLGNVIAFNSANGVFVASGRRNGIRQNAIHSNALLGIDLGPGANNNQAAPVLNAVVRLPNRIQVTGTLTSTPNTMFTIEIFADFVCDPSDFGEGRIFLGSVRVRTNAAGLATFTFVGLLPPDGASFITATATDPENNTSEFSRCEALPG